METYIDIFENACPIRDFWNDDLTNYLVIFEDENGWSETFRVNGYFKVDGIEYMEIEGETDYRGTYYLERDSFCLFKDLADEEITTLLPIQVLRGVY